MTGSRQPTDSHLGKSSLKPRRAGKPVTVIFQYRLKPDGTSTFPVGLPSIAGFYGLPPDQLAADASAAFASVFNKDRARVKASIDESAANMTVCECEFRIHTPDNGLRWLLARAVPFREDDGSILWHGFFHDVTSQKASAAESRRTDRLFRTYVESAPVAILATDGEGRIQNANPSARRILGYDLRTLRRLTVFDLCRPQDVESARRMFAELPQGEEDPQEFIWQQSNQQEICVQLRVARVNRHFYLGFFLDITERRQAEAELHKARNILESFIEYAPACIALLDRNMRYLRSSLMWRQCTGLTSEPLVGKCHYDLYPDLPEIWLDAYQRGLQGETLKGEDTWNRRNGTKMRCRWEVHPWNQDTEASGIILVLEDVTRVRETEAQFRQAQKLEAIGRLAGGVAHDCNNLLMVMGGAAELLRDTKDPATVEQYLSMIDGAVGRSSALTRQLLTFSRKQSIQPSTLNLNEVVTELLKLTRRLLGEDIQVQFDLAPDMQMIEADRGQIEQIIMNLAVNSRDAMPEGGILTFATQMMEVNAESNHFSHANVSEGRYVLLSVADSGTGMSEDTMAHIFEPFFTTKEPGKGTGLGLATVYGIVQQNKGTIFVSSQLGEGTRFEILFPSVDRSEQPGLLPHDRRSLRGTETVLVVEDDAPLRHLVVAYLETSGYKVLQAADGPGGLAIAEAYPGTIYAVVADLVMPGFGGAQSARTLLTKRPDLRIVLQSGYDRIDSAESIGAVVHRLQKPYELSALGETLQTALK